MLITLSQSCDDDHAERVHAWIKASKSKNLERTNQQSPGHPQMKKTRIVKHSDKEKWWLLALILKGCTYKSLPFPEQPGPSFLWACSYAFNDALYHRWAQPSPRDDTIPLPHRPPRTIALRESQAHATEPSSLRVARAAGWGHAGFGLHSVFRQKGGNGKT